MNIAWKWKEEARESGMMNLAVMSSMPFARKAFVLEDGVYSMAIATDCLKSCYPGIKPNKNVKK